MKIYPALLLFLFFAPLSSFGQQRYFVYFKDKPAVSDFDPVAWFHPHAISRRINNGIPLVETSDLPVSENYICEVESRVLQIRHSLRWLNAVSVDATDAQIEEVLSLPFVSGVEQMVGDAAMASLPAEIMERNDTLLSLVRSQMNLDLLVDSNLTGRGVRIAILDAGFEDVMVHPALDHVRKHNRIEATRDFYDGDDNVYQHSIHGMQVMSCIAGKYNDRLMGAAPDAMFLLARVTHEKRASAYDEDNWIAAAEWAERQGADIISSSITFSGKPYTYESMDGKTTPVSRSAAMAVSKGLLVICSMGNEGDTKWRYMGAPADVPGVLSVGGSLPVLPLRNPFSSFGPNSIHERKPDISAPGFTLTALKKLGYGENAGTSFSTPLIAGVAACLIQRYPESSRAAIFEKLCRSGHFYPYYDYELGYGIADMARLFGEKDTTSIPAFEVIARSDSVILKMNMDFMYRDSVSYPYGRVLNYHLENPEGYLSTYYSIRLKNTTQYYFFRRRQDSHGVLRIWLGGYLYEMKI